MLGSIKRMGTNIPILYVYIEDPSYEDQVKSGKVTADEARRKMLIEAAGKNRDSILFLNPDRTPLIYGMHYGYSLVKMANDMICDTSNTSKMTGVNSKSQLYFTDGFLFDNLNDLTEIIKDFYVREGGIIDYAVNARINGIEYPLKTFYNYITRDPWELIEVIDKKKGTSVDRYFIKSLCGMVIYDDDKNW